MKRYSLNHSRFPTNRTSAAAGLLLASSIALAACGAGSAATESTANTSEGTGTSDASETEVTSAPSGEPSLLSGTAQTVAGGQVDLGSLEGQDTILWFWASW